MGFDLSDQPMMDQDEATLEWRPGDVPVAVRFDDPYYSLDDGLAEARFVFLDGNDLPARFAACAPGAQFHVAELGFGTGLNAAAALSAWRAAGAPGLLRFTSFEAYPLSPAAMARALAPWVDLAPAAVDVLAALGGPAAPAPVSAPPGAAPGDFRLEIIKGDARETLPRWGGTVDAWFLDGFSPAKNPAMWDADLLRAVAAHTRPGGTCATYTAAGAVRRALAAAGFEVTRATGFGRKRHMTRGRLPGDTAL